MLWAYFNLSQFLIIWSGNLPEEITWYLARTRGGWQWVALVIVLFHFALPFVLLLSHRLKRRASSIAAVALVLVVMRFVDVFWLVTPAFDPSQLTVHLLDVAAVLMRGRGVDLAVRPPARGPAAAAAARPGLPGGAVSAIDERPGGGTRAARRPRRARW